MGSTHYLGVPTPPAPPLAPATSLSAEGGNAGLNASTSLTLLTINAAYAGVIGVAFVGAPEGSYIAEIIASNVSCDNLEVAPVNLGKLTTGVGIGALVVDGNGDVKINSDTAHTADLSGLYVSALHASDCGLADISATVGLVPQTLHLDGNALLVADIDNLLALAAAEATANETVFAIDLSGGTNAAPSTPGGAASVVAILAIEGATCVTN